MKKNKLKITYLDFDDIRNPLLGAGQARATLEVCSRLVEKGNQIEVISSKYPGYENRIEKGIKYTHIGLASKNLRLNNLAFILALPFIVRKLSCDLIIECFTPPISTLFSPLFTKIPVVALTTSFEAERFAKKYHLPFHLLERFGLHFYRYFLPTSRSQASKIKKINPKAITKLTGQGVDAKYFKIKKKRARFILYLGRLDINQKGIDLLLEAYSKAESKIRYPLILAGHGPDESKIKKMIKRYKLTKKVHLLGGIKVKNKLKTFSQAHFFVVSSRHEGFCIAALEAIATGLPVVAFDIPGISWIPEEISLKAKPFDTSGFADKLIKANKKSLNEKLRRKCRRVAKKYSWDEVAKKYDKFFHFVVEENKALKNNKNI
jgi:glycosyltransferase involved in cell wall biosynthesis